MINVRLLLAVVLGALPLATTDPLVAAAIGTLLLLIAATKVDLPMLSVTTVTHRPRAQAQTPIAPQTMPAGPGRPQPRAPGARYCASS